MDLRDEYTFYAKIAVLDLTPGWMKIKLTLKKEHLNWVYGVTTMPVYEFECKCGHNFEELVKMGTQSMKCPKCQSKAPKIISPCTFELKGGGWYADGYSTSKKK
ncbi:MAG: zinc ribbon domain-containing protein [Desulfobacteraceae bacterium]|jgi:putative FmdB family regulatory protein